MQLRKFLVSRKNLDSHKGFVHFCFFRCVLALTAMTAIIQAQDYSPWSHHGRIILNTQSGGANVSNNVSSFPVLVRLNSSNFDFTQTKDNGEDIRFSKSDYTAMPYEIERWDKTGEQAEIWVRVDTVYGNNSTQYYVMHWGNSGAGDESNGPQVFQTGNQFNGVWHFGTVDTFDEATINDMDAINNGSLDTAGVVSRARFFEGIDNHDSYVTISDNNDLDVTGNYTVSLWVYDNAGSQGLPSLFNRNGQGSSGFWWNFTGGSTLSFQYGNGGGYTWLSWPNRLGLASWNYLAYVKVGSDIKLYKNGVFDSTATMSNPQDILTGDLYLGTYQANASWGDYNYKGRIDEFRIADTNRTTDWIKLCYENQKQSQSLVTVDTTNLTSDTEAPLVLVTAPSAGAEWGTGSSKDILWTASDNVGVAKCSLFYSIDNAASWVLLVELAGSAVSHAWSVPIDVASTQCVVRVKVIDAANNSADDSSDVFTIKDITAPTSAVTSPNTGTESWEAGTVHDITWTASDNIGVTACSLYVSYDNGSSWAVVARVEGNPQTYAWTVTGVSSSSTCLIKVMAIDAAANATPDLSDNAFTITVADAEPPVVAAVSSPAGGAVWNTGSQQTITWTDSDNVGVVSCSLYYSLNGGTTWVSLARVDGDPQAHAWDVPLNVASTNCKILVRAFDAAGKSAENTSQKFTIADNIAPTVTVTKPDIAGTMWPEGSEQAIQWTADDNIAVARCSVFYSIDDKANWIAIGEVAGASNETAWQVISGASTMWIRVTAYDAAGNSNADESDAPVMITAAPFFTSSESVDLEVDATLDYTIEYDPGGNSGTPAVQVLSKPDWVIVLGNKLLGNAPLTATTDTVKIELRVGDASATMDLKINVYEPAVVLLQRSSWATVTDLQASPSSRGFNFTVSLANVGRFFLAVYNVTGRMVWSYQRGSVAPGVYELKWNPEIGLSLGNGSYLVRFVTNTKQISKRIVLTR